jgi:hypothetical protein
MPFTFLREEGIEPSIICMPLFSDGIEPPIVSLDYTAKALHV